MSKILNFKKSSQILDDLTAILVQWSGMAINKTREIVFMAPMVNSNSALGPLKRRLNEGGV